MIVDIVEQTSMVRKKCLQREVLHGTHSSSVVIYSVMTVLMSFIAILVWFYVRHCQTVLTNEEVLTNGEVLMGVFVCLAAIDSESRWT